MPRTNPQRTNPGKVVAPAALLALLAGCADPFQQQASDQLRESVVDSARRELGAASPGLSPEAAAALADPQTPWAPSAGTPLARTPSELVFEPARLDELRSMAGPDAYTQMSLADLLDADLLGGPTQAFVLDLQSAISGAVRNNLDVRIAEVRPAVSRAQLVAAEAAFDWVLFSDVQWNSTDEPSAVPIVNGFTTGSAFNEAQSVGYDTGLRKRTTSGGTFSVSQGQTYLDNKTDGVSFDPDPSNAAFVELGYDQPLLRGGGSDTATAEIRLARNAERSEAEALRAQLLATVTDTERAYWRLVQARREVLIRARSLQRGIETRDVLKTRLDFDVRPSEFSDAVATVESRRADLIRAVNTLRQASDELKTLVNDPNLVVAGEVLLVPIDDAMDRAVSVSLLDSLTAAVRQRPELTRALLGIDDASIRQQVADNARLPRLDLSLRSRFAGLDRSAGDAYQDVAEGQFVNFVVAAVFEQPLGNRGPEAEYRLAQLQRTGAALEYRRVLQRIVLDVKSALRNVQTNYRLIEQNRSARLAATENVRTLQVQEQTIQGLTPDFLDLKLRRQEALAQAELNELASLIDYNIALAELSRATGEALERNRVRFEVPTDSELLRGSGSGGTSGGASGGASGGGAEAR